jgi:LCP family protein required for cell wall assembly
MRRNSGVDYSLKSSKSLDKASISGMESRIGNFSRSEGFTPRKARQINPDGRGLGRQPRLNTKSLDMNIEDKKANKRRLKKPKNLKKMLLRTTIGFTVLGLLVGGYIFSKGFIRAKQVFKGGGEALAWNCEPDPQELKAEGDGRVNVLILGKGGPEQRDGPDLTDTIMLSSIDPCNKEAGLLSIPRDLAVKMKTGESSKINAVYALTKMSAKNNGKSDQEAEQEGIDAIEESVENVLGTKIHYYVMVDFTAFEKAVDAVGGIDINVKKPVYEKMSLKGQIYVLDADKGMQHFDGIKALAYSRSRYTSVRGDFDRSERQREVIVALRNKVLSVGTYSNPVKVSQLIDSFGTRVSTNLNIKDDVGRLYGLGQEIGEDKIKSLSLVDEPNVLIGGASDPYLGSIQIPKEGIFKYDAIKKFVRTNFIDGFIKKENPSIVVLNGTTTPNLATQKSKVLKSYGYNIVEVGDGPDKDVANTILVDLKNGEKKYTKRYLELRHSTTSTNNLPTGITLPENTDFVIILGQNETSY